MDWLGVQYISALNIHYMISIGHEVSLMRHDRMFIGTMAGIVGPVTDSPVCHQICQETNPVMKTSQRWIYHTANIRSMATTTSA